MPQMVGPKGHLKTVSRELSLLAWEGSSGVVDQDVQGVTFCLKCGYALPDGCKGSQVKRDRFNDCVWISRVHPDNGFCAFLLITRGQNDVNTSCCKFARRGKS